MSSAEEVRRETGSGLAKEASGRQVRPVAASMQRYRPTRLPIADEVGTLPSDEEANYQLGACYCLCRLRAATVSSRQGHQQQRQGRRARGGAQRGTAFVGEGRS